MLVGPPSFQMVGLNGGSSTMNGTYTTARYPQGTVLATYQNLAYRVARSQVPLEVIIVINLDTPVLVDFNIDPAKNDPILVTNMDWIYEALRMRLNDPNPQKAKITIVYYSCIVDTAHAEGRVMGARDVGHQFLYQEEGAKPPLKEAKYRRNFIGQLLAHSEKTFFKLKDLAAAPGSNLEVRGLVTHTPLHAGRILIKGDKAFEYAFPEFETDRFQVVTEGDFKRDVPALTEDMPANARATYPTYRRIEFDIERILRTCHGVPRSPLSAEAIIAVLNSVTYELDMTVAEYELAREKALAGLGVDQREFLDLREKIRDLEEERDKLKARLWALIVGE